MRPLRRRRGAAEQHAGVRVLVADDDPVVRDVLEGALRSRGFVVTVAEDGQAALDAVATRVPDAAVLDWVMPALSGPEVCERLRAQAETAGIPVVLLTAQADEQDVELGYRAGADEYVTKPFHPREVLAVLDRLLAEREPDDG